VTSVELRGLEPLTPAEAVFGTPLWDHDGLDI
jgi:hypothetical protein